MKKFVSGLILAVVVTPALAENEVEQLGVAPSMLKTSSYTLEVKEGENTLSTLNFAAIDSEKTKVSNWTVESHAFKGSNATETYKAKTGFEMTLHPVRNSENFIGISFEYRQPIKQNKQEQPVYTFETGVVLAKGGSFCTDLSGTGEKVKFCLSRI
ncbi:hypothetical protein NB545_19995 [Vibrio campbellii]|uniref:hypothetical protein n=1 Tax=Vibrio harveyi group TaxID=717610 RepID=UPI00215BC6F2|nr:hypothetical protein [Vibrio campbellii]MCR9909720.1 hypothetical protein [Vibrio campbellii]